MHAGRIKIHLGLALRAAVESVLRKVGLQMAIHSSVDEKLSGLITQKTTKYRGA